MKRGNGEGSIRQRKTGLWEGRYTAGHDKNGKSVSKSVFGKTRKECQQKLKQAIEESQGLVIRPERDYTVAQWLEVWFEVYSKPNIRPGTANYYDNYIRNHIIPAIGDIKLAKLTGIDIQNMYNKQRTGGRVQRYENMKDKGLSVRTIRGIHMLLHEALQQAVKEMIIPRNPCDTCTIPKLEKKEMNIIPTEKIGCYLQAARNAGVEPMFYLELSSGLRRGELLALTWDDVDVERCIINVDKQVGRINGEIVVSQPKTPSSIRKVMVPRKAIDLLLEEREKHPDCPYVFMSNRTGGMVDPNSVGRIHKRLLKDAGIDGRIRFHDLRHTFTTICLENGADVKTVSAMLGHTSSSFTLDQYGHLTPQMQKAAADKMADFMDGAQRFVPVVSA